MNGTVLFIRDYELEFNYMNAVLVKGVRDDLGPIHAGGRKTDLYRWCI